MIITQKDIDDFIEEYSNYQLQYGDSNIVVDEADEGSLFRFYNWLANNPQVLMASGFQEFVGAHKLPIYKRLVNRGWLTDCSRPIFRKFEGQWILVSNIRPIHRDQWEGFSIEALRNYYERTRRDPALADDDNEFEQCVVALSRVEEIISKAEKFLCTELYDPTIFVSPKLWTPVNQDRGKMLLQVSSLQWFGQNHAAIEP